MRYTYEDHPHLDASGYSDDQERLYSYRPPIDGSVIDTNSVILDPDIHRGSPELRDVDVRWDAVRFTLFSPAARGFPFGRHSGSITVHVSFQYFDSSNVMSAEELKADWVKAQAALAAKYVKEAPQSSP
jgi:hypothetical protein